MNAKPLPIRLRLTLWYFVMFATAALLLSAGSWWMLRRTLNATVQQDLQERVDDVVLQLHQFGAAASPQAAQARFENFYRDRDDGKWLQILDQDGRWIYRSPRMISAEHPAGLPRTLSRKGSIEDLVLGSHHVRAFALPVSVDGIAYTVETGISMKKPGVLLHKFSLGLLLLIPAVLLPAALGGHFMSRQALAPVAAIAAEARRITDRNLERRLPVSETSDELSHLSITLNNMLERIDLAFRSVRDFTANASHELRTPLARIRTETEISLLRPRAAAEYRNTLEHVHQDAVEMSGLVENLLTLARAEAGREVLRLAPVDIGLLSQQAIREWAPVAESLSVHLSLEGAPAEPLLAFGDRLSLVRLLRILLDNACKFTPAGGSVAITAARDEDVILLQVKDSGIGIPVEHQARIFDRFYRVAGDSGRQAAGAGLGLSLAAWIAEQHRTRITVESTAGRGSRFEIRLAAAPKTALHAKQGISMPFVVQ